MNDLRQRSKKLRLAMRLAPANHLYPAADLEPVLTAAGHQGALDKIFAERSDRNVKIFWVTDLSSNMTTVTYTALTSVEDYLSRAVNQLIIDHILGEVGLASPMTINLEEATLQLPLPEYASVKDGQPYSMPVNAITAADQILAYLLTLASQGYVSFDEISELVKRHHYRDR